MASKRRKHQLPLAKRKTQQHTKVARRLTQRVSRRNQTARQLAIREKALHAVARARRKHESLSAAAREEHVSLGSIERHLPAAVTRNKSGQLIPTKGDRYRRNLPFITALGDAPVRVFGSHKASVLMKHRRAVEKYAGTGDESLLRPFVGLKVAGQELITDPHTIQALLDAGAIDFHEVYASAVGGVA